jgi:hypothetical protein
MRSRAISFLGLSLIWMLLASVQAFPQDTSPTEYQIKAAFIFNFAKFVQWPTKAIPEKAPLVIGILGENPFHEDLERTIRSKIIDDHPLMVKEFRLSSEATNCHILFISATEKSRLPEILAALKGTSVLTVSEVDKFTESGGMINFVQAGTKIRFEINNDAAANAGLKVSSKLMALAIHSKS